MRPQPAGIGTHAGQHHDDRRRDEDGNEGDDDSRAARAAPALEPPVLQRQPQRSMVINAIWLFEPNTEALRASSSNAPYSASSATAS